MSEPRDHLDLQRGRELFVMIAAMTGAMSADLLLRRDYSQALIFAAVAISCIQPIQERPRTAGTRLTALLGLIGIGFWFAFRYGTPALLRRLA
jgi:hypothetical protein